MGMHINVTEAEVYLSDTDMEEIAEEYIESLAKKSKPGFIKLLQELCADFPDFSKAILDLVPEQELKDYIASNYTARSIYPASELEVWAICNGGVKK